MEWHQATEDIDGSHTVFSKLDTDRYQKKPLTQTCISIVTDSHISVRVLSVSTSSTEVILQ